MGTSSDPGSLCPESVRVASALWPAGSRRIRGKRVSQAGAFTSFAPPGEAQQYLCLCPFPGPSPGGNKHIPRPGPTLGGFLGEAVLSSVPVGTAAHHYGLFAVNGWHFDDFQVRSPRVVAYFMAGSLFPAKQPRALYGVAGPGCHQCAQVALLPRRHPCGVWAGCPVTRWPCSQQSW